VPLIRSGAGEIVVAKRAFHKVVADNGLAGSRNIFPLGTAMDQVGVPEKNVALGCVKIRGLQPTVADDLLNERFVELEIGIISAALEDAGLDADFFRQVIRKTVAAGVIDQR